MTFQATTLTSKLIRIASIGFFIFILWIIYVVDTGSQSALFKLLPSIPNRDKIGHFLLFGLLTLAFNFIFKFKTIEWGKVRPYLGSMLVLLFVIIEEFSQGFIATRTMDFKDLVADALGILLFTWVSYFVGKART